MCVRVCVGVFMCVCLCVVGVGGVCVYLCVFMCVQVWYGVCACVLCVGDGKGMKFGCLGKVYGIPVCLPSFIGKVTEVTAFLGTKGNISMNLLDYVYLCSWSGQTL